MTITQATSTCSRSIVWQYRSFVCFHFTVLSFTTLIVSFVTRQIQLLSIVNRFPSPNQMLPTTQFPPSNFPRSPTCLCVPNRFILLSMFFDAPPTPIVLWEQLTEMTLLRQTTFCLSKIADSYLSSHRQEWLRLLF